MVSPVMRSNSRQMYSRFNIIIIVCILLLVACSGKTKDELYSDGLKLLKENNPSAAIVLFKNALSKDQNFFEARHQLAKAYLSAGKADQAVQEYQKLVHLDPSKAEFQLELARSYVYANMPDQALSEISQYVGKQQVSADTLEIQGYAYIAKGNNTASENCFTQAIRLDPERVSAKLGLATAYGKLGRNADADSLYKEIINSDPSNLKAYYGLASLQTSLKQTDRALLTYKKIVEIAPDQSEALYRTGLIYADLRKFDDASQSADALLKKFPKNPSGFFLKGLIAFYKNDLKESISELQQSINVRPTLGALYFLGVAYYQKGEYELSLSQLQKVLDADPANIQARLLSSLIHLHQKRMENAITVLKQLLQANPDHAFAHNLLGSAYLQKGMNDEGMKELATALRLDSKLVDAHLKKGMFNLSTGNFKDAEIDLQAAVKVAPEVISTRLLLTSYYMKRGDFQKAINTLKDGLTGSKGDAVIYTNMAAVLNRQNKPVEALSYLNKAKEVDPDFLDAYFNAAFTYTVRGENNKAFQEYQAILQRDQRNVRALVGSAMLLEMQGKDNDTTAYYSKAEETKDPSAYIAHTLYFVRKRDTRNALAILDESLKIAPSYAPALELKGKLLASSQRFSDALAVFNTLESVAPDKGMPFIINTHIAVKDYANALKVIESALAAHPEKIGLRAEMARVYVLMGDEQRAVASANKIIDPWKNSAAGYIVLATVYDSLNKHTMAIEALKKGVQTDSRNISARIKLGDLYAKSKEYSSALSMYESALKLDPHSVLAHFAEGTVYERMGKNKEALKKYQKVLDESENYVPALNNVAFLYLQGLGSKAEALELAMKAYKAAPELPQVMDTLGLAFVKNGRVAEAFEILKKAVALLPYEPSIQYHLALVYRESGDTAHAKEALSRALKSTDFPEAGEAKLLLEKIVGGNS